MGNSRGPLALVVALVVLAGVLLIALVVQPTDIRAVGPDRVAPQAVEAARTPTELAAAETRTGGAMPQAEKAIDGAGAEIDPPSTAARNALGAVPPTPGILVHGFVWAVWGSVRPEDCALTLNEAGGRRLTTHLESDASWSFDSVPPGKWTLSAEAPTFRPRTVEFTLRGDEGAHYLEVSLESASFVPVHLVLESREAIAQRLQHGAVLLSSRTFRFVSTRAVPDRVVTADVARAGGEPGVPAFRCRSLSANGSDPALLTLVDHLNLLEDDEYTELPADCVGIVPHEPNSSFHLSLCLGTAVLRTVEIDPSIGRAAFTVAPWDLEAACTTLSLRLVDAERNSPLPDVPVSVADAGGATTSASSGPDGRVRFEGMLPGWYALSVRVEGRAELEERILVAPGLLNDLGDRRLQLSASIQGFVVDEAGRPVEVALLARPLGAVDDQRFVRAWRGQSSAADGTFTLQGLGRGPHVILLGDGERAARPVRVDTTPGDVLDVRIDTVLSTPVRIQLPEELRVGTLVRLDTPEGLPVFAAVLQTRREHRVRIAPGRYRLSATLEGRGIVDRQVDVGGEGATIVVQPEKR